MAIGATLQLHGAEDPPQGGVERILIRLELDCLVCEAQGCHVLLSWCQPTRTRQRLPM
jgi:hypothetical protein